MAGQMHIEIQGTDEFGVKENTGRKLRKNMMKIRRKLKIMAEMYK